MSAGEVFWVGALCAVTAGWAWLFGYRSGERSMRRQVVSSLRFSARLRLTYANSPGSAPVQVAQALEAAAARFDRSTR